MWCCVYKWCCVGVCMWCCVGVCMWCCVCACGVVCLSSYMSLSLFFLLFSPLSSLLSPLSSSLTLSLSLRTQRRHEPSKCLHQLRTAMHNDPLSPTTFGTHKTNNKTHTQTQRNQTPLRLRLPAQTTKNQITTRRQASIKRTTVGQRTHTDHKPQDTEAARHGTRQTTRTPRNKRRAKK